MDLPDPDEYFLQTFLVALVQPDARYFDQTEMYDDIGDARIRQNNWQREQGIDSPCRVVIVDARRLPFSSELPNPPDPA